MPLPIIEPTLILVVPASAVWVPAVRLRDASPRRQGHRAAGYQNERHARPRRHAGGDLNIDLVQPDKPRPQSRELDRGRLPAHLRIHRRHHARQRRDRSRRPCRRRRTHLPQPRRAHDYDIACPHRVRCIRQRLALEVGPGVLWRQVTAARPFTMKERVTGTLRVDVNNPFKRPFFTSRTRR